MEVRRCCRPLLFFVLFTVAACSVGEYGVEQQGTTPDAAMNNSNPANETSFNNTVKPLVSSCLGCHSTTQAPNLTSFTALQAKYKQKPGSTNILVTKGPHQGTQYFNTTDKTAIQNWIDGLQ
jgi:hypothetical protein